MKNVVMNNCRVRLTSQELAEVTDVCKSHIRDFFDQNYIYVTKDEKESIVCAMIILSDFPVKVPRRIEYKEGKEEFDAYVRAKRVWVDIIRRLIDEKKEERKREAAAEELVRILCGSSEDEEDYYGLYDAVEYGGLENYGVEEFKRRIKQRAGIV